MKKNKRKNTNLKEYLNKKGLKPEHIVKKYSDSPIQTQTDLRYYWKNFKENVPMSLSDLRNICDVIFIFQNIVYVSDFLSIPELFYSKQLKETFNGYSTNRNEINSFLDNGLFIFDVDNFDNFTYVFMDWEHEIIAVIDKYKSKEKLTTSLKEVQFLDEYCNIPDELYDRLFGKESEEDEENFSKFDDEYFDLEEQYGEDLY